MISDNDIELGLFQKAQSLDFIAENIIKVASSLQSEWEASVFVYGWGRVIPVNQVDPITAGTHSNESAEKINKLL